MKLASLLSVAKVNGFADGDWVESKDQDPDGGIRLLQLADVGDGIFRDRSDRWINEDTFERLKCLSLHPGDILIARMPDPLGRSCLIPRGLGPCITVVDVAVLSCDPLKADARFISYALNSHAVRSKLESSQTGSTRQRISRRRLGREKVPCPPLEEQRAIADYLDAETARIDTLIAEQQRLIELLRERRQAVVTRTCTLGLGGAELADSGNIYLGWVPKHWGIQRFSRAVEIVGGLVDPSVDPWIDTVLIAPNHVESGTGRLGKLETAREQFADSGKYTAKQGQLLYSKIRPNLNKVAIAPSDCLTSADMYVMQSRYGDSPGFLAYFMRSQPFHTFATLTSMRVKMPKINREELGDAPWVKPPLDEQRRIAAYLDEETAKIDSLIAETEKFIELSQERRSALITAAVTGQIDVREVA